MRTTLTLDPDVVQQLRREMKEGRKGLKEVVNERLRIGFGVKARPSRKRFTVKPHASEFRAGVDPGRLNQIVDELEAEEAAKKMGRVAK